MNTHKSKLPTARRRMLAAAAGIFSMLAGPGVSPAGAAELLLIGGQGDDVSVTAAALRTRAWKTWSSGERWVLSLAPEWQVGYWTGEESENGETRVYDFSTTGVLTIRPRESGNLPYFVDIGFGVHMLSDTRISEGRIFGSSFQFGEFLGVGADFGQSRRYSFAARIQHVSNGGIKRPNPGVTFMQVSMMYRF